MVPQLHAPCGRPLRLSTGAADAQSRNVLHLRLLKRTSVSIGGVPIMLTAENRTRALSILLVLQGGLILVGAVLLGLTGSVFAPLDSVVGADASIAAVVLGPAFILAYRQPTKVCLHLAILYNASAIAAHLLHA